MTASLIGLDWGTTSLRGYRLDAGGAVLDCRTQDAGILRVADGDFDAAFEACVGAWLDAEPDLPLIASGMIGSRQGWVEAPYVPCPAGLDALAAGLTKVQTKRGATLSLVPGITHRAADGVPDVARGEETQILGALDASGMADGLFVLPGTHTKWALARDGAIVWFATFMTGEVFDVLCRHSILGRMMDDQDDPSGFARGLAAAAGDAEASGGLLHRLFSARTLALFDELPAPQVRPYLSGLLIGQEIVEAGRVVAAMAPGRTAVTLIGGAALVPPYRQALAHFGYGVAAADAAVVTRGLARIADAAGLLRSPA
jgi:2-dehydro-3-deoxygalactonokinase